jgi:hypothetical protein
MKKLVAFLLVAAAPAFAQDHAGHAPAASDHAGHAMPDHAGHDMAGMDHGMAMHGLLGPYAMSREGSGTSWQPEAAPHAGIHLSDTGDWMVMWHAKVLGVLDSQSGPRGDSMAFATGMAMGMASRDFANGGTLAFRGMLSLDPFMGRRGYSLLLAAGETADGVTHLVNRQHPHELVMEMSASYSQPVSASDSLFLYAGYPGEPALGPGAYMHRPSALDNPMTPISHHWLDSTHITFGVLTAGWVHDAWKLEVSQFTGREPDQYRFDFDVARFDSTAVRLSFNPDPNWSFQVSAGWLKSPEGLHPGDNEQRLTASASWYDNFDFGALAVTAAFGNKRISDGRNMNAGLIEATYKPDEAWSLFARGEVIESGELVPEPGIFRAGEVSLGLVRDFRLSDTIKLGLGGLYAFNFAPFSAIAPYDGGPRGAMAFVRLVAE